MRKWINLFENSEPAFLYHGTSASCLEEIYSDGLTAPSYWGTYEVARSYEEQFHDGVIIAIPIDRFVHDELTPNDNLYRSQWDDDDAAPPVPDTWQESLEDCGSVIYNVDMRLREGDVQSRLNESVDLPMDKASRMERAAAMGFTTPAYHGTGAKFNEFDMEKGKGSHFGFAPYFASERQEAKGYADDRSQETGTKSRLMSVLLRVRKPLIIPDTWGVQPRDYEQTLPEVYSLITGGKLPHETKRERYLTNNDAIEHAMDVHYEETGNYDRKQIWRKIYDRLISAGYDAIVWKGVRSDYGNTMFYDKIVMLDMSGIRLTSAKFDPSQAASRDLRA